MISAGVEGRLPLYMTYPEPWRGPLKQPPELFLRPAPKPLPATTRYNGINTTTYPNGTRLAPPPRQVGKYPSSPTISNPVNLVQPKEDATEEMTPYSAYRIFPPTQYHFPYSLCQPTNLPTYLMRTSYPPTPLSPIETFSSSSSPIITSTFRSPPDSLSPPSLKNPHIFMDKKPSLITQTITVQSHISQNPSFKVPGKEGSLKHRILIRPEDNNKPSHLDIQKPFEASRKRLQASVSPPRSPRKSVNNNNNTLPLNFTKGSLIQLHSGELRRIEEMRTEDFIVSAERSPELRLAQSTVVRIEENQHMGNATITLSYNNRRAQADVESSLEHPYFVVGQGWTSCCPERTQQLCGLKVHQLQVGDVLISVTPREPIPNSSRANATIMTTSTKTSMTAKQQHPMCTVTETQMADTKTSIQTQPINLHLSSNYPHQSISPDSIAARKRRWSAPDQICDEQNDGRRKRNE